MVVNFSDYKWDPEAVVEEVLRFVNADMSRHKFTPLPPAMKLDLYSVSLSCHEGEQQPGKHTRKHMCAEAAGKSREWRIGILYIQQQTMSRGKAVPVIPKLQRWCTSRYNKQKGGAAEARPWVGIR
eukprot:1160370-Pelagomonas_calceolata.AAC.2